MNKENTCPKKSTKKVPCKEHTNVEKELSQIQETNSQSSEGKPETPASDPKGTKWSKRQKMAWLNCYNSETDHDTIKEEVSRWVAFSNKLWDEYGVWKDNMKCQKQVID